MAIAQVPVPQAGAGVAQGGIHPLHGSFKDAIGFPGAGTLTEKGIDDSKE